MVTSEQLKTSKFSWNCLSLMYFANQEINCCSNRYGKIRIILKNFLVTLVKAIQLVLDIYSGFNIDIIFNIDLTVTDHYARNKISYLHSFYFIYLCAVCYSLFFIMSIFLKHLRLIPNKLKRQSCKIFTKLRFLLLPSWRHRFLYNNIINY